MTYPTINVEGFQRLLCISCKCTWLSVITDLAASTLAIVQYNVFLHEEYLISHQKDIYLRILDLLEYFKRMLSYKFNIKKVFLVQDNAKSTD